MSANDIGTILRKLEDIERRLDSIDREHAEDMGALGVRLDLLTKAHSTCAAHCWVGSQEQIRSAVMASIKASSSNLPAVEDEA